MTGNALLTASKAKKTFVEIDLGAIKNNLTVIKESVGRDKKILLPVKADGYGHGAVQVSKIVEEFGFADILGVSSTAEGIELREAGIKLPILILGLILPCKEAIKNILDYDLTQTVADISLAREISNEAGDRGEVKKLHLKIDTGMGRIGCRPEEAVDISKAISELDHVELEGVFSHFPVPDDPDSSFTKNQIEKFKDIIIALEDIGIDVPLRHIANSAAVINYPDSIFNTIRPGIAVYGYRPAKDCNSNLKLIPSMSFKSYIVFSKRVNKGTPLSYGLTYTTQNDTNIATIPVGYGDGYSRFLSNKGGVIIRDKTYPVVGRVCMDNILIDLGDDEYPIGEEVVLFGNEGITVETVADWIGTIPYEVTCAISKRVPRKYLKIK